jgi:two-component system chemotaxis response regulator CheY
MANILIVDDDVFIHKVMERALAIGGHVVVGHAYNGVEAVELVSEMKPRPQIIIMDQRMPIMDGISATKEIFSIDPTIRILFVSADETATTDALNAGAYRFLTKPIRTVELLEAVSECIGCAENPYFTLVAKESTE